MRQIVLFFFFIFCLPVLSFTQKVPDNYFRSPLDITSSLSGNFAELRNNHFHSGVDYKTNGKEGLKIYAVADGYVSRIRVSPWGFGKAVYIDHPNGYTSVYAHLRDFNDSLENYMKSLQYELEEYSVDSSLQPGIFVKKGDVIGYSGNTGSSSGPHLHFEIRETDSEFPQNPELFGFKFKDSKAPIPYYLYIYPLESNSRINGKNQRIKVKLKKSNGTYVPEIDKIICSGKIGVAIKVNDYYDLSSNKCGIFRGRLYHESKLIYGFKLEEFSFFESRYINAHMDYKENLTKKDRIHKFFIEPNNKMSIYDSFEKNGEILINDTLRHNINLVMDDVSGNSTSVHFKIQGREIKIEASTPKCTQVMPFGVTNIFQNDSLKVVFEPDALYDTCFFKYNKKISNRFNFISPVYSIHNYYTPIHSPIEISITPDTVFTGKEDKMLIVRFTPKNKIISLGGDFIDGNIVATSSSLGDVAAYYDTVPPVIKPINVFEGAKFVNDKKIEIKITDNLSGIQSYKGTIDGKWVLFKYIPKKAKIVYYFDENIAKTGKKHELKLTVTDERKNMAIYKVGFYY